MFEVIILTVIPELTQDEFDTLLHFVSPEKQERIKKFHFFRDARNCLLGDILVRAEICRSTGIGIKQLKFTTNAYGKPFLINKPYIQFNTSHSECYVTCVVANEPVGIDIELIKPVELKIAERFFASDEAAYVMNDDHTRRFYEIWTKKESHIKWEGQGLHKPLPSFSVFEFDSSERKQPLYYKVFQNDEVICHVCSTKQVAPTVRIMRIATFMQCVIEICNN